MLPIFHTHTQKESSAACSGRRPDSPPVRRTENTRVTKDSRMSMDSPARYIGSAALAPSAPSRVGAAQPGQRIFSLCVAERSVVGDGRVGAGVQLWSAFATARFTAKTCMQVREAPLHSCNELPLFADEPLQLSETAMAHLRKRLCVRSLAFVLTAEPARRSFRCFRTFSARPSKVWPTCKKITDRV